MPDNSSTDKFLNLIQNDSFDQAQALIATTNLEEIVLDKKALSALLQLCAQKKQWDSAFKLYEQYKGTGFSEDSVEYLLINLISNGPRDTLRFCNLLTSNKPDDANTIINKVFTAQAEKFSEFGSYKETGFDALIAISGLEGIKLDGNALSALLKCCAKNNKRDDGVKYYEKFNSIRFSNESVVDLLNLLIRIGDEDSLKRVCELLRSNKSVDDKAIFRDALSANCYQLPTRLIKFIGIAGLDLGKIGLDNNALSQLLENFAKNDKTGLATKLYEQFNGSGFSEKSVKNSLMHLLYGVSQNILEANNFCHLLISNKDLNAKAIINEVVEVVANELLQARRFSLQPTVYKNFVKFTQFEGIELNDDALSPLLQVCAKRGYWEEAIRVCQRDKNKLSLKTVKKLQEEVVKTNNTAYIAEVSTIVTRISPENLSTDLGPTNTDENKFYTGIEAVIKTLICNIEQKKGGRWLGVEKNDPKIKLLQCLLSWVKSNTEPSHADFHKTFILALLREICALHRSPIFTLFDPHSFKELPRLLKKNNLLCNYENIFTQQELKQLKEIDTTEGINELFSQKTSQLKKASKN